MNLPVGINTSLIPMLLVKVCMFGCWEDESFAWKKNVTIINKKVVPVLAERMNYLTEIIY